MMPRDPESLHDEDWRSTKATDAIYAGGRRYEQIAEVIAALAPRRVLDVGCGSGYLASLVRQRRADVVVDGADISSVALARARTHLADAWHVDLDRADLPIDGARYDVVTCVEVIEHLYDVPHALAEIGRVLRCGGQVVATVPNVAYWRYRLTLLAGRVPPPARDPRHLHQFDATSFAAALAAAGFVDVRLQGHAVRLRALARRQPALLSDILIATARKPG
jgi:2-polyprenyl-3-methyl-5-hydroxy-6-metoxy-1,4-benzoquinol methylase